MQSFCRLKWARNSLQNCSANIDYIHMELDNDLQIIPMIKHVAMWLLKLNLSLSQMRDHTQFNFNW